jgi:hypothetical protein
MGGWVRVCVGVCVCLSGEPNSGQLDGRANLRTLVGDSHAQLAPADHGLPLRRRCDAYRLDPGAIRLGGANTRQAGDHG